MVDRSGGRGSEQHNVLLVNDDGPDGADQRRNLERRGFHVIRTSDTNTGLTIARQTQPRAIFLSARELGSEWTPFLQALRRDDSTRHIPVVVLAADRDASLQRLGLTRVAREPW
jgi:PleD family two-component response regulator